MLSWHETALTLSISGSRLCRSTLADTSANRRLLLRISFTVQAYILRLLCAAGKKSKEEQEKAAVEEEALTKVTAALEAGKGARSASLTDDEAAVVKGLGLLTLKPLIYAANVGEDDLGNHGETNVHVQVNTTSNTAVPICNLACLYAAAAAAVACVLIKWQELSSAST